EGLAWVLRGLSAVAAAEAADRAVEPADLVLVRVGAEETPVEVGSDRDHAAAHRDARLPGVARVRPGRAEELDLLGLELVERHLRVLEEQRRAHQVHSLFARPDGGLARAGAPPDPVGEAGGLGLDREHRVPRAAA